MFCELRIKVEKLLKSSGLAKDDPLQFKPNVDALEADGESDESNSEGEQKQKLYKPPKFDAVYYRGDRKEEKSHSKHLKKLAKLSSSSYLAELRTELSDKPVLQGVQGVDEPELSDSEAELRAYEEEHFTRLPLTKKMKRKAVDRVKAGLGERSTILDTFNDLEMSFEPDALKERHVSKKSKKNKHMIDL